MFRKGWVLCLSAFLILGFTAGCKSNSEVEGDITGPPVGTLAGNSDCLSNQGSTSGKSMTMSGNLDCIVYNYDGKSYLTLTHKNSCFNCCPGTLSADIIIEGNTISITEHEADEGCKCLCLMDLEYQIRNLEPGQYTLRVDGKYVEDGDDIVVTLDLSSAVSNEYCVSRSNYPWNI